MARAWACRIFLLLRLFRSGTWHRKHVCTFPCEALRGHSWSPDGKLIATVDHGRLIKILDAGTGKEINTFRGHSGAITSLDWSPDGKRLASTGDDLTIKIWDWGRARIDGIWMCNIWVA